MNTFSKKTFAKLMLCAFAFQSTQFVLASEVTIDKKSLEESNDSKVNKQIDFTSKQKTISLVLRVLKNIISKIPDRINEILEANLLSISVDLEHPVFLYSDFSSKFIKSFFEKQKDTQGKPFEYLSIDVNDDETTVDKLKAILEHNPPKVISLSNIYCKDFEKFRKIFNLLKNTNKVLLVYIEKEKKCFSPDCQDVDHFNSFFEVNTKNGLIDELIFDDQLFDYYKLVLVDSINELKRLNSEGESILTVDISDEDIDCLADSTRFLPLEIDKLYRKALITAIQRDCKLKLIDFVSSAFAEAGIPHSNTLPNDNELLSAAVHECGHAIVAHICDLPVSFLGVSSNCSGLTADLSFYRQCMSYKQKLAYIKTAMAGQIAQELLSERGLSDGANSDFHQVEHYLEEAVILSDRSLSSREDAKKDAMLDLYQKLYSETKDIVLENGQLIKSLAERLMKKEFVSGIKFMSRNEFLHNIDEIKKDVDKTNELQKRFNDIMPKINDLSNDPVNYEKFITYVETYFKDSTDKKEEASTGNDSTDSSKNVQSTK